MERKKRFNNTRILVALCWLVYTCSYIGKLGYNANITQIESVYGISHSTAGLVSTFFFFAYGIGQIINGFFCKRYNLRLIVFCSLLISGLMNFLVGCLDNFSLVKYFWLINGAALSILWPSLIRLLSETLDKKDIAHAVVLMGTTIATGTFLVYGLSALFVAFGFYEIMFFAAGVLLPLIALIWIFSFPKLVRTKVETNEVSTSLQERDAMQKQPQGRGLWFAIVILAFFAIVDNLVKDGLTTWVPMILKDTYSLPDYSSILLTMFLPLLAIFGTKVAVVLNKKMKDFVVLSTVLFLISAICIGLILVFLSTGLIITLGCLGMISCLMAGVNTVITSMAPLYWKERINSGMLAGILNGFCYLGSCLSAYGLGEIADVGGWNTVFVVLLTLCLIVVGIAICYMIMAINRKMLIEQD